MSDIFELYDLEVNVTGDPNDFACAHVPGLAFRVEGENLIFGSNPRFSMYSLAAIIPLLPSKQRQLDENDWMLSDVYIDCPDPLCGARFQVVRKHKRSFKKSDVTKNVEVQHNQAVKGAEE